MKYNIAFYEYTPNNEEKIVQKFTYHELPPIPRKKEIIGMDGKNFKVLNVAYFYTEESIDIDVEMTEYWGHKEWWD